MSTNPEPTILSAAPAKSSNKYDRRRLFDRHESPTLLAWNSSNRAFETESGSRLAKVSVSEFSQSLSTDSLQDQAGQHPTSDDIQLPVRTPKRLMVNAATEIAGSRTNNHKRITLPPLAERGSTPEGPLGLPKGPSLTPKKKADDRRKQEKLPGPRMS